MNTIDGQINRLRAKVKRASKNLDRLRWPDKGSRRADYWLARGWKLQAKLQKIDPPTPARSAYDSFWDNVFIQAAKEEVL